MANVVNWFEVPVSDFDRAKDFYTLVTGGEMHTEEILDTKMAFFNMEGEGVGGAICAGADYKPSAEGATIYLNGGEDLAEQLSRVEPAGGTVIVPKTKITDEIGFFAMFMDTEGNKMAFHSPK
ncbi:MAG: VOC family protein [Ignavibacteriae bacterium]|nr:VOC family protein [Ignavibacteriota bacterium]